jgi:para-aminobenzoate synthetase component 1
VSHSADQPFVVELPLAPNLEAAFARLAHRPHCLWLDSARRDAKLGRYSFLAADPFMWIEAQQNSPEPLARLEKALAPFQAATIAELPPFQGGAAGLLSYDLGRSFETIPQAQFDEFGVPVLAVGLYDVVLAVDHWQNRAWIISHGWPETEPARKHERAKVRAQQMQDWLNADLPDAPTKQLQANSHPLKLSPQFAVPNQNNLTSNFHRDDYLRAVARGMETILAGDVFQVNLAQRLLHPAIDDATRLYLRLRNRNPATFAAYFDLGEFQIVSASPERFLRLQAGHVETRPIKGTRPRVTGAEADLYFGDELLESEKDRAENVMIVDLLRNDLSRVCQPESVSVSQLCRVETVEFVQHLVSVVEGKLAAGKSPLDLLRATFPGGSITGAPKIRAMQIISQLEPTARGAYCGSLGYLGFDGTLDTSILIRTIMAGKGWWQLPVGGGITAQSVPELEYAETWHKAEGMLRALLP